MRHEALNRGESSVTLKSAGNGILYVVEMGGEIFRFLKQGKHLRPLSREDSNGIDWERAKTLARTHDEKVARGKKKKVH